MRRIELCQLVLEHFRSFHARTTVEFSPTAGLKFVSGDNKVQPRLGANGAGKSTLWDAVTFCLYGSSVRGLKASELVSWGEKAPYARTDWLVDGQPWTVERYGSPNKLLVNGQACEQIVVERLIGVTRLRFLQGIVFGQGVPLFIDLSVPERGGLLDEVLDLGRWLRLSEAAGKKHALLARDLDVAKQSIAFLDGKLQGMPSAETIQVDIDDWEEKRLARFTQTIVDVEAAEAREAELMAAVTRAVENEKTLGNIAELRKTIEQMQARRSALEAEYRGMRIEHDDALRMAEFFKHNTTCPECSQSIDKRHALHRGAEELRLSQAFHDRMQHNGGEVNSINEEIEVREAEYNKLNRKREHFIGIRATAEADLRNQRYITDGTVKAVEAVMEAENPHKVRLDRLVAEREEARAELRAAEGVRRRTQGASLRLDFWKAAFKRVRLFLVKRILAQLELETATAAASLGLVGWKISYTTELETKSGSLRPGIFVQITAPGSSASVPWEAWSGGEGQRIRLATAIGLAAMIQRLAGISIGFEVWDEPTAFLAAQGVEDLLDCLKHRVDITGKSIWLCDHHALTYSGFSEIWSVTKTQAGSEMRLLTTME